MFTWISSLFRSSHSSDNVKDVESAFQTTVKPGVVQTTASVPFAGRKTNIVFGIFFHGRPRLWWQSVMSFFKGDSAKVMITMSNKASIKQDSKPAKNEVARKRPISSFANIPRSVPAPECDSSVPGYNITDFIAHSPYQLHVNPHYQPVAAISEKWLDDHGVHPSPKKRAAFEACNFGLLTAMCYAEAPYERFRVLCDFINCLFAFDDLTDEGGLRKDNKGTRKASDIIMNSLWHPFTYKTEFRCGQVFASFWGRALESGCSEGTHRRFLEASDLYMNAVHEQVICRATARIPTVEEFIKLRRDTGALKMCFAAGEYGAGLDLPDEVFDHPYIKIMENCSNDVVVISNDVYSYNIEQAQGDTFNILEVCMKHENLNLQQAMDFAGQLVNDRVDLYTATKAKLPSWGPEIDAELPKYFQVLEDWMTAGFYWSLESKRYFGDQVDQVRKTLRVDLLPRQTPRGQMEIPDLDRC
ncbi:hypothetical protein FRC03_011428 [Tulasnella sp. 419]|nr:hypothetical protein FRC02_008733 [Tulasnella sp. 418]KAG8954554.1 hypothetical protein FRC03_011428 [Tulasnella sp. 419]